MDIASKIGVSYRDKMKIKWFSEYQFGQILRVFYLADFNGDKKLYFIWDKMDLRIPPQDTDETEK